MAVKENVRKRKHKSTTGGIDDEEDGEVAVPKKMAKKQKSPKKQQQITEQQQHVLEAADAVDEASVTEEKQQEYEEQDDDAMVPTGSNKTASIVAGEDGTRQKQNKNAGPEEVAVKFPNDFKMMHFRTKLRGNDFITELRHFLHVCETRPKMCAKYIEKRGKPLELAEAFDRVDKANVLHVAYLCEALQLVLMEIVSNQKDHMESAEHASRYFLKTHGVVLNTLLDSSQLRHRCTALKLLTAMVCVEPQLGRQLLSSYDILSNAKAITKFLSHPQFNMESNDGGETTVRKCFIHFVLSFLVDGNVLLIRNILDRPAILQALTYGLLYDDHVTVCVVLNTLKKYVLECADISKTKKIHVFDHSCCKNVAQLYDWKGPLVFKSLWQRKKKNDGILPKASGAVVASLINAEQLEAVAAAAHEFLLVLLTSRKHGITFDAITHFRQRHNAIQGKVIGGLYKPWCDERKTELVLKILTACPDLARHTMRNYSGIVNVLRTPPQDWVKAVNFLAGVISTLHPRLLRGAIDKITLTDFVYWIKDVCLPIETLVLLEGSRMLRHANVEFRIATNRLLLAMFTQYTNYMRAVRRREKARGGDNAMRRFKFDILNHILVNFPAVDNIVYSLSMTTMSDAPEAVVLSHLDVTLDLVLSICRENRSFVNKTNTILDYLKLLRPLYARDDERGENREHIRLELKAVKTILTLFPKALDPKEELFGSVLDSFIKAYVHGEVALQREAGGMLRGLFRNTGLFEASEFEIDLWLEPLRYCDADTVEKMTQVFIEVLQVVNAEVELPKSSEVANLSNLRQLLSNIENGFTVQAYIDALSISKMLPLILKGVEIVSPLDKYLELVCLLLFHYYPMPEHVLQLYRTEMSALSDYMAGWLARGRKAKELPQFVALEACVPHLPQVYTYVLSGDDGDALLARLFDDAKTATGAISERSYLIYVQQALFLAAQLHANGRLASAQADRVAGLINRCLGHVRRIEAELTADDAEDSVGGVVGVGDGGDDGDGEAETTVLDAMLKYVFNVRLTYLAGMDVQLFSANDESHLNCLRLLHAASQHCRAYPRFLRYTLNYRLKIVKAIALLLHTLKADGDGDGKRKKEAPAVAFDDRLIESMQLIDSFELQVDECVEILQLIAGSAIRAEHLFSVTGEVRRASIYHELIVRVLQRLTALRATVSCPGFMAKIVALYTGCVQRMPGEAALLEKLEETLHAFLLLSHQHIPQLDAAFFEQMFVGERKLGKPGIRLACLLLERDEKLSGAFLRHLPQCVTHKELCYPLLGVALQRHVAVDAKLLQAVYQEYKNGFMKTIEKPQKAAVIYREHVECSIALVQQCMPLSECVDFTKRSLKIDGVEVFQLRLIDAIYQRAMRSLDAQMAQQQQQHALTFGNFVLLQVQILALDLKRQMLNVYKLRLCAHMLHEWWQHAAEHFDAHKIISSLHWSNFCKATLKAAMQQDDEQAPADDEACQADGGPDVYRGLLLQLLAYLCERLYCDYQADVAEESAEAAQLFEMVCTHSRFYDILLAPPRSGDASRVKTQLLHLLYVLGRKSPSALSQLEIPVVLGAYQARLSASDRYALALLQLFEQYEFNLTQYRPLIWGESAIAFYALRSADEERAKLRQQETSIAQVMSLVDKQVCEYTIGNFPIWRRLATTQQMPAVHFEHPDAMACNFGTNRLERRIEASPATAAVAFEEAELRLCPKRDEIFERCYDPAFFVPLMSMCFAPEAYAHPARPVQNGLLGLVFAALSSQDRDMRLGAACVQQRYRSHFEQNKFFERPLWIQTYENIQAGLNELRESWLKHKKNSGTPRVPYISCLFVAKTFNLIADPTHLLYKQLTMYLRLKSSFNFQCVPEFNKLFYSAEIEHHAQRQFIVEVIRDGIKCSSDLFLLVTTNIFKVLMGFYGSTMSTLDINLLILSVFSTCVKIPASTKIIIEHVGILPWLSSIISATEFHHFDIIEGLITILNNLWYALKANQAQFHNFNHLCAEIHRQMLTLAPHLSARIGFAQFAKFLNILNKTASANGSHAAMSSAQLDNLISCTEIHCPALVHSIQNVRRFGGAGAAGHTAYCMELHEQHVDATAALALSSLRAYTIDWWRAHNPTPLLQS